jgi:glutamyl-tRNA(Gln) amidotransferase subunit E
LREITDIFENTGSSLIRGVTERGGIVLGERIEGLAGVLVEDKAYADKLQKKAEEQIGVKGYISTDELPAYGISKEEKEAIESRFDVKGNDVVILVADKEERARKALEIIKEETSRR